MNPNTVIRSLSGDEQRAFHQRVQAAFPAADAMISIAQRAQGGTNDLNNYVAGVLRESWAGDAYGVTLVAADWVQAVAAWRAALNKAFLSAMQGGTVGEFEGLMADAELAAGRASAAQDALAFSARSAAQKAMSLNSRIALGASSHADAIANASPARPGRFFQTPNTSTAKAKATSGLVGWSVAALIGLSLL